MTLLGEVIFVGVLAFIANASDAWGRAVVMLLVAIWLVWLVSNSDIVASWADKFGIKG